MPPRSRPRARSRSSARAVRNTIGIDDVRPSSSNSSATRHPSRPGIITSRRITSGLSDLAFSRPLGPSAASSTSIPSASRLTRQRRRIGASSSITSTLVTGPLSTLAGYTRFGAGSLALAQDALRRQRQREREAGALALPRLEPDAAAHRLEQLLRDEQAEAGAAAREVATGVLGAVELREDPALLRLRDADALVVDPHLDGLVTPLCR